MKNGLSQQHDPCEEDLPSMRRVETSAFGNFDVLMVWPFYTRFAMERIALLLFGWFDGEDILEFTLLLDFISCDGL